MDNKELKLLNFNRIVDYNIDAYRDPLNIECKGFCIECEKKGILDNDERLITISHGADSSDYYNLVKKEFATNKRVMIVFENPGGNVNYDMGDDITFNGITKYIPIYSYYWIDGRVKRYPETKEELLSYKNLYGPYIMYLINRYSLNNVYITNVTKCKSSKSDYHKVRENCIKTYFEKEIEIFDPELFILMGHSARNYFYWDYLKKYHAIKSILLKHPAARTSDEDIVDSNNQILDKIFV